MNGASLPILHEDNHLLVVNKPAGMLSQGDLSGDLDVLTVARQMIRLRDGKPGNVYMGLVHRLDRPVAGAMVLAKTSKCASRLSASFRARETHKCYLAAVTAAPPSPAGELCHRLDKDRLTRITRVVSEGGKEARLRYRVLDGIDGLWLVEVMLITGLPHQIRAQLAAIGSPIAGDRKYGAPGYLSEGPGVIALYSHRLRFAHPTMQRQVEVTAPPPAHFPMDVGAAP